MKSPINFVRHWRIEQDSPSIHWLILIVSGFLYFSIQHVQAADDAPFGIEERTPWTSSRVVGSPDPPLPYTAEKTLSKVSWPAPLYIAAQPGTDQLLVVLQGGERGKPSRILRVGDRDDATETERFLAMTNRLIYSVTFHPGYATNRYLFVFSNGPTPESRRTNRISRFTVERDSPFRCDPQSEHVIIEWRSAGHDGGGMVFGHDGMFYISSGDGTTDSDTLVTGQDLSELNGGILRIDIEHPSDGRAYSVPKDNPFIGVPNARPENWAFGLRNPWRMTIDQKTGQIWVGNNGQDLWETAHLIRRGENYGWSVYEGNHPFYLNRKLGPTPPVAPTIEHSHFEARSLTGGVVYYGELLSELNGAYVYGDYATGKIWGARHDGSRMTWHQELADTQLQIASFAVSHRGEILIVDHGGGIYRLIRSPKETAPSKFPTRLSETGVFVSTKDHQAERGLIPYSVNAPGWTDGAHSERFIGLPGTQRIGYASSGGWNFPDATVLVQTLSLEREMGSPSSRKRIETRLLTRQNGEWVGYSYRWSEDQSDAVLVQSKGRDEELSIRDASAPGGVRKQTWHYPSRAECMGCHGRAANFLLGLTEVQMNKTHDYGGVRDNQLRTLAHLAIFTNAPTKSPAQLAKLVDPYDSAQPLEARARSYLHANCSVCHVEAGGGNAKMELGFNTSLKRMNVIEARPQHDTFGIDNAMLIAPGDPKRSIVYQRISRRGRGQMPPIMTTQVDERAVTLFRDWILGMESERKFVRDWKMADLSPLLDQIKSGRSFESGREAFRSTGCSQCHRFAGAGGSVGPDLSEVGRRLSAHDLLESLVDPSKVLVEGYASTEIETKAGESISGRVERENDQMIVLRPLSATEEPVTVQKADIARRSLSKVSNMPAGIINTLQEKEVIDLLAYLVSDGNSEHAAFRSGEAPNQPKN